MEERSININGIECNYRVSGSGEDVLILHGWGSNTSSNSWKEIQKEISKNGFRVFALDLPGFGKTKAPNIAWGVSDYKKFVMEFLNKNQLNEFYLIGHSFGGRISIKLANEENLRIKKMILCSPAGIKINPGIKTSIIIFFANIGKVIFNIFPFCLLENIFKKIFYFFIRNRDYVKANDSMKGTMQKIINEDLTPLLKNIKINTLLIWGNKDKMIPLKYAYIFKEEIKNSSLVIIRDSGHSPNRDNPLKLSEEIIKFL